MEKSTPITWEQWRGVKPNEQGIMDKEGFVWVIFDIIGHIWGGFKLVVCCGDKKDALILKMKTSPCGRTIVDDSDKLLAVFNDLGVNIVDLSKQ